MRSKYQAINQLNMIMYLLTHPCIGCGESNPLMLTFHHIKEKKRGKCVRNFVRARPKRFAQEMENCIVLCYNCHRQLHAFLDNSYNYRIISIIQD